MQTRLPMFLTTESHAWAVAFAAGLTGGVILGHGVTPWSIGKVVVIAVLAVLACAKLLRDLRDERLA